MQRLVHSFHSFEQIKYMEMKKLLILMGVIGFSCDTSTIENKSPVIRDAEMFQEFMELRESGELSGKFEIVEIERTNDRLFVTLKGGCEGSNFSVVWDGTVMESWPMQVNLLIVNDKLEDGNCKLTNDSQKLEIDLKALIGDSYEDEAYIFHLLNGSQLADKTTNPDGTVTDKN